MAFRPPLRPFVRTIGRGPPHTPACSEQAGNIEGQDGEATCAQHAEKQEPADQRGTEGQNQISTSQFSIGMLSFSCTRSRTGARRLVPSGTCRYTNTNLNSTTVISKQETFYVAYAPDFDVSAYGACRDEALNNLQSELVSQPEIHAPVPAATPSR